MLSLGINKLSSKSIFILLKTNGVSVVLEICFIILSLSIGLLIASTGIEFIVCLIYKSLYISILVFGNISIEIGKSFFIEILQDNPILIFSKSNESLALLS